MGQPYFNGQYFNEMYFNATAAAVAGAFLLLAIITARHRKIESITAKNRKLETIRAKYRKLTANTEG